jgi:helicase SWR1
MRAVDEGGLLTPDDPLWYTEDNLAREVEVLSRLEQAAEPGGLLDNGVLATLPFDEQEQDKRVPRQYAHQDHLVRAARDFRQLMLDEHKKHRRTAKRLADACRDSWLKRQPKTLEELEAEARKAAEAQYKSVVKVLQTTWDNVRTEVNRRRVKAWEAAEQIRVRKALNEAVDLSTQKLEARRVGQNSEFASEAELESMDTFDDDDSVSSDVDEETDSDEEDESNMSSQDSEEDEDTTGDKSDDESLNRGDDEQLTVEELRAKYANLPDASASDDNTVDGPSNTGPGQHSICNANNDSSLLQVNGNGKYYGNNNDSGSANEAVDDGDDVDDSDESIDMDDDMGSSDEDAMTTDDDSDASDSEASEGGTGLLGFFASSELSKIDVKQEGRDQSGIEEEVDEDLLDEDDEVSLVPHVSHVSSMADSQAVSTRSDSETIPLATESKMAMGDANDMDMDLTEISTTPQLGGEVVETSKSGLHAGGSEQHIAATIGDTVHRAPASEANGIIEHSSTDPERIATPDAAEVETTTAMAIPDDTTQMTVSDCKTVGERTSTARDDVDKANFSTPAADSTASIRTPVPFLLRGTLREYQHHGLDWLAGLYANNTNGILADEMGLGKTIQTIALLAHLACEHHVWGPHLVIVPTSVMLNWEMEFKKWCPGFKILAYYGNMDERKRKRQGWTDADTWNVCITSYQLVLQDQQVFKRRKWHYMILDEAHNIKNFRSQRWQTLLGFNTRARLLLTGTPLQNNLNELWSLLFFLMPSDEKGGEDGHMGGFADLKEFQDWFRKPQEQILESGREDLDADSIAIVKKLHKVLRPYILRRMKADVEKQMPGKYEHVEYCRLSRRQRELYDGFLSRSGTRETLASGNYLSIINCLMQLRKVCNHPDLFLERPILSSFPMKKSAVSEFEVTDSVIRRRLLHTDVMSNVSLRFLNLIPTHNEHLSCTINDRANMLTAQRILMDMREAQRSRAQNGFMMVDPSTVKSSLTLLESVSRWSRFEELQHCVYLNALRRQSRPIYGKGLVDMLDFGFYRKPSPQQPTRREQRLDWLMNSSTVLRDLVLDVKQRSEAMEPYIQKFACITPPITTPDSLPILLSKKGVEAFQTLADQKHPDPFHEARMRLSVQFPDKRLLQYDCGKLQALDKLLRKLQAGGHRALIFTQMTKVLDILEQFLNIHGHRYLRLDGATKIEQRQILTDRFNNDTRILAFILSSRSGGMGINLTGADTVIFYDLDWNPAMDKQCQDRAHRIGQTRDVHIYRLISEHTIEVNILRKANQKRMLDDVVIQEGEFTTDYFNKKASAGKVLGEVAEDELLDGDAAASAAMDRVLGGPDNSKNVQKVLEQAEDKEDVTAAKVAAQEIEQDEQDFDEKTVRPVESETPMEGAATPATGPEGVTPAPEIMLNGEVLGEAEDMELNAWGNPVKSIDDYMLAVMDEQLKGSPVELPKERRKSSKEMRRSRDKFRKR